MISFFHKEHKPWNNVHTYYLFLRIFPLNKIPCSVYVQGTCQKITQNQLNVASTGFPVAIREINVKIATTMRFVAAAEQVLIGFLVVRSGWQPLEIITGWWEWVWGNWSGLLWVLMWGDTEWPIITSGRCESCPNCHGEFKFSANKTAVWDNRIIYHIQFT